MWSTFATDHQPIRRANTSEPSVSGITWDARTPVDKSYLNISAEPRMESNSDYWARMDFWSQTVETGCWEDNVKKKKRLEILKRFVFFSFPATTQLVETGTWWYWQFHSLFMLDVKWYCVNFEANMKLDISCSVGLIVFPLQQIWNQICSSTWSCFIQYKCCVGFVFWCPPK